MNYPLSLIIRLSIPFIISYNILRELISPLTLNLSYYLLKLIYPLTTLQENIITIDSVKIKFITACAAISAYYLLLILIMLTKNIPLLTRVKMFFLGSLSILLINLLRIYLLVFILLNYGVDIFNKIHLLIWASLGSVLVAMLWLFLIKYYKISSIPIYTDLKYLIKQTKVFK